MTAIEEAPRQDGICGGIGVAALIAMAGVSLLPFLLPSSRHPEASLTVWTPPAGR